MHDNIHKQISLRTAQAVAVIFCSPAVIETIKRDPHQKGELFGIAKAAGFLGAKATPQLLPQRHAVGIDSLQLEFEYLQHELHETLFPESVFERQGIVITGKAKTISRADIEMETLTAVSVAALEIFDKLKSIDTQLEIGHTKLLEMKGGKGERKKFFFTAPVCAVLVCSDAIAAGTRQDRGGKLVKQMLEEANAAVKYYAIVPGEREQIQRQIKTWVAEDVHFIFTVGGTGLGPRHNTVETVLEILEREAEGIAEAMRAHGQLRTPLAMMSRGVAGAIGETLIVTLPGSTNGARESLEAILPAVFHARKMMKRRGTDLFKN